MEGSVKFVHRKLYVVWEVTLKCNLSCNHCGSRAGAARTDELSTEEALDLVDQMAEAGVTDVTMIGGEAYLRKDWLTIGAAIRAHGMRCGITTGGYGISQKLADKMAEAGVNQASVSVDGLKQQHDGLRGVPGSFDFCFKAMECFRNAGIHYTANSQINRVFAPIMPLIYERLQAAGAKAWQLAMTVPMGHAADNPHLLLQPYELLDFFPMLAYLSERGNREGLYLQPGNNVGYYGPYERLIRGFGEKSRNRYWMGCQAGLGAIGIEADGSIKGCPSLPTAAYVGGNIRETRLKDIIEQSEELNFNNHQSEEDSVAHLWGFCKSCEFASVCRGGCSWTSHVFFDKRGNNPLCHHRALVHAGRGVAERFDRVIAAPGQPFDNGRFATSEMPMEKAKAISNAFHLEEVQWPEQWLQETPELLQQLSAQRDSDLSIFQ